MTNIENLHRVYCEMTGMAIRLDMQRECEWARFAQRRFTVEDLRLVIRSIQRGIKNQKRHRGALRFSNLVVQLDYFEEELAMAQSEARVNSRRSVATPARDEVCRATGRPTSSETAAISAPVKTPADILADKAKFAEQLKKWREENK